MGDSENLVLPVSAQRVQEVLSAKGSPLKVRLLSESTATAQDAARALNVELMQIAKSIVFDDNQESIVLALLCGDQTVDPESLARAVDTPKVTPLNAKGVKRQTGFVIGGVSPFGLPSEAKVVIDTRLAKLSDCYIAAGHPKAVIRLSGEQLITMTSATVASIVR